MNSFCALCPQASGILLIVFGSIALASPSTIISLLDLINGVSNITPLVNVGSLLEGMAIFMIVDGSLLFLFGGVGCHGAHRMHKRVLMEVSVYQAINQITLKIGPCRSFIHII